MSATSESDLKPIIKDFIERLYKAIDKDLILDAILENTDIFFEKIIYNLGRQMNRNADWRSFFTEIDKQTIKEIFPDAFISFSSSVHPFVKNINVDDTEYITFAKKWMSYLTFFKNEIFNYYKELCDGNMQKTSELENSISDLDDHIENLLDLINYWSEEDKIKDYLDEIPDLNGVPESHFWWTEENRLFSKNKFQ